MNEAFRECVLLGIKVIIDAHKLTNNSGAYTAANK